MMLIDAANALAVQVGGRRADDLDPVDDFGGDAVDENRSVVAAARNRPAVDQDLGEAGAKSAKGRRVIFANVAAERDARNALQRVADRRRLELLEEFLAEREFRRDRVRAIAVDARSDRTTMSLKRPIVGRFETFAGRNRRFALGLGIAFGGSFGRWLLVRGVRLVRGGC